MLEDSHRTASKVVELENKQNVQLEQLWLIYSEVPRNVPEYSNDMENTQIERAVKIHSG